jgi:hypothetical protein
MKRITLVLLLCLVVLPLCLGQLTTTRVQPVMLASPQSRWLELGTITASQAYPDVNDRDWTAVAALEGAKTIVWNLDNWARRAQLSFQTTADADSTTIAILGFADNKSYAPDGSLSLDDDAVFCGSLVLTGGTQMGKHTNVYADTAVATDGVLSFAVLDSATNRRCVVEVPTKGFKYLVFIATTLQGGSTLYAEGRLYQ